MVETASREVWQRDPVIPGGTLREPIAIIGMACLYPKAPDLDAFWSNILAKVDAVTDPPPDTWDPDVYYDPTSLESDRVYCKRGGYLGGLYKFDPLENGIPPVQVGGEPDQWLALQIARDALADAGYTELPEVVRRRTEVILGRGATINGGSVIPVQHGLVLPQTLDIVRSLLPELTEQQLEALRQALKSGLPAMGAELAPGLTPNIIVGRIANRLDLMGASYTVDAACASSLIAVQHAVRDLGNADCDLALAGGSHVWTPVPMLTVFCQLGALSHKEQIRPFDKDADGTILGEGLGMLVLKRLADAERDGDRIYSVIRGVGVASDGRANFVMAPRVDGEELAMRRAYASAGISPESVELIEAHGTGTPVGDLAEIQALTRVFGARQGLLPPTAIGSVKSMISHTIPAAGAAGMIKASLALHHKVLPPTLHCDEPDPRFELEKTPFYVNGETRPWVHATDEPRRAGVSAFGFGGINAHVVLEEYRPAGTPDAAYANQPSHQGRDLPDHRPQWDSEVCVLEGSSRAQLIEKGLRLLQNVEVSAGGATPASLRDVACTLAAELRRGEERGLRLAIVATSLDDLQRKLTRALQKLEDPACAEIREAAGIYFSAEPLAARGKLAFVFPGEGSQYANMLADLFLHFPEVRDSFDETDRLYREAGRPFLPSDYVFPRPGSGESEAEWARKQLWDMDGAVVSVLTADEALLKLLQGLGVRPHAMVGHSSGEFAAMLATGVFGDAGAGRAQLSRQLMAVYEETRTLDDIPPAVLLAIGAGREQVEPLLQMVGPGARVAMDNCPHQVVVATDEVTASRVQSAASAEGFIVERLLFDRPYHTSLYAPYALRLRAALAQVQLRAPDVPVYSCATSGPFPDDAEAMRDLVADQWRSLVEFRRTIEALHADGVSLFVEVGPRNNLTSFIEDILRGKRFAAVASNTQRRSGISQLNYLCGLLAAHGVDLDLTFLFRGRSARRLDWTGEPQQPPKRASGVVLKVGFPVMKVPESIARELHPAASSPPPAVAAAASQFAAASPPQAFEMNHETSNGSAPHNASAPGPFARTPAGGPVPLVETGNRGAGQQGTQPRQEATYAAAHGFLETMEHFLRVQEGVLTRFLAMSAGVASPDQGQSRSHPNGAPAPVNASEPAGGPATPVPPADSAPPAQATQFANGPALMSSQAPHSLAGATPLPSRPEDIESLLVRIASDRTGYPAEAIDLDSDLEADLGIDSIKRVEILGELRHQLGSLAGLDVDALTSRRTLREILTALMAAGGGAVPRPDVPAPTAATPAEDLTQDAFLGAVLELKPGEQIVCRRLFDPEEDALLRDHCIGRELSVLDPELRGLPLLPLAMMLEFGAQAAAKLAPGRMVTALRDVNVYHFVSLEDGARALDVAARVNPDQPGLVSVQVFESPESSFGDSSPRTVLFEAAAVMEDAYPQPPVATPLAIQNGGASRFSTADLYDQEMFHGPRWRAVKSLLQTGANGAAAELETLPLDAAPGRQLDPVLIDAAGQVLAFWTHEQLSSGWNVFPFHVDEIRFFAAPRPAAEPLTCLALVRSLDAQTVSADIEVSDRNGRVLIRLDGWRDRRFYLPEVLAPIGKPRGMQTLSIPDAEGDSRTSARLLRVDAPQDAGFVSLIWAWRILSRLERAQFLQLARKHPDQVGWLAERQVAKEAVAELAERRLGVRVLPADIELSPAAEGHVLASGKWLTPETSPPVVQIEAGQDGWLRAAAAFED